MRSTILCKGNMLHSCVETLTVLKGISYSGINTLLRVDNIPSHNRGITSFNLYGNLLRVNFERNYHRGNYFKLRKL